MTLATHPFFLLNATATTEIYTLSLHDALPIWSGIPSPSKSPMAIERGLIPPTAKFVADPKEPVPVPRRIETLLRSEEHTSELQSRRDLVCRLLLEKKKKIEERYT